MRTTKEFQFSVHPIVILTGLLLYAPSWVAPFAITYSLVGLLSYWLFGYLWKRGKVRVE